LGVISVSLLRSVSNRETDQLIYSMPSLARPLCLGTGP